MRYPVLLIVSVILMLSLKEAGAQLAPKNCATDLLQERLKLAHPDRAVRENQFNQNVFQSVVNNTGSRGGDITIPLVVHIIHENGAENISNAMVMAGIEHLNQAFSNTGPFQDEDGVDTHIRFCLAQQDEFGYPSDGITRDISPLTTMTSETDDEALKNLVHWDPLQYLNIYLVNEITSSSLGAGIAGYAYFPSSHGMPEDGIVNEARWFGSSVDNSKIHIHEAGHYLGLYHTFNGGCGNNNCLFDGDKVCDTPPEASTAAVVCNESVNTCTTDPDDHSALNPFRPLSLGGLGDKPDQFVNYMDYGFQTCQHLLTAGQSDRMNAALTTERASLLLSPGCENACSVFANFTGLPDVTIGAGISYPLDGLASGPVGYTIEWLVNGVVMATTEDYVFEATSAGNYTVTFRVSNPALNCFKEKAIVANVICGTQLVEPFAFPANPEPGQAVLFTGNYAPGTTSVQWLIDGVPAALGGSNFNHIFQTAGEYYVSYITTNGICSDTSRMYVPVGQCNGGEALTWWFGNGNMLTFYGDDPIQGVRPVTTFHQEGVANICDVNGNLILYSDGIQAFNGQGVAFQNAGLLSGGGSSSQAALIVPNPSDDNLYYIFTTGDAGNGSMSYVTADISQNQITGGVQLVTQVAEKQAAVKHCNGYDTWVVTQKMYTNAYYAYLVTDQGVSATPVISYAGAVQNYSAIGCMKFSPQGNKLAMAVMLDHFLPDGYSELMDFDNATGVVSSSLRIQNQAFTAPYGIEFSPDGSKLYIGNAVPYPHAVIYQYDLSSGNASEILASGQLVGSSSSGAYGLGSLQLAKNGKIYVARTGSGFLDEISNPDLAGVACGVVDKALTIQFNNFGLPNFVVNSVGSNIPYINGPGHLCANSTANYSIACGYQGNVSWNYTGPGTMQVIDGDRAAIQSTTASGAGRLIAIRDAGCLGMLRDTFHLQIGSPQISLGVDTVICTSGQLHLSPGAGYSSYLWNDGSTMSYLDAQGAGNYSVQVTGAGGCSATSSIQVNAFDQQFDISLGDYITLCPNYMATVTIPAPQGNFASYQWSTGQTTPSITVGLLGTYSLAVTNEAGCIARDTIEVTYREAAPFEFAEPATICPGGVLVLNTGYPEFQTEWQDGSDLPTFTAWQPGLYWATISNGCNAFAYTDYVLVTTAAAPVVNLGNDTVACPFTPFNLIAGTGNGNQYLWNDGSTSPSHPVNASGNYIVTVTNSEGCSKSDSIKVEGCPTGITQNETGIKIYPNPANDYFDIYSSVNGKCEITVFNSAGSLVLKDLKAFTEGNAVRIECGELAAGIYAVRIAIEGNSIVMRVIIEK